MAVRRVSPEPAIGGAHGLRVRLAEKLMAENFVHARPEEVVYAMIFICMGFISGGIATMRKGMAATIGFGTQMFKNNR